MEKKQHPWVICANVAHDALLEIAVEENQPGAFRIMLCTCFNFQCVGEVWI